MAHRVNIGCGMTILEGWRNFDNSPAIGLAQMPGLAKILYGVRLIRKEQYEFVQFARNHHIERADALTLAPLRDNSVDVLYSSHMIEHLDHAEAKVFLRQVVRVLKPGGIVRISVPDIAKLVNNYLRSQDADEFIEQSLMCVPKPKSLRERIKLLLTGPRHHHWMYDARSLGKLMTESGLVMAAEAAPGMSRIPDPGGLDLRERAAISVYVEAVKSDPDKTV